MNIFAKLSWRTMKKSRTRTIVTVTGVILATAMILAVLIFGLSVQQYMLNYAIRRDGNWHFMESTCSPKKVQELTADESVKKNDSSPGTWVWRRQFYECRRRPVPSLLLYSDNEQRSGGHAQRQTFSGKTAGK